MTPRYLYHWTHQRNLLSILRHGLDPAYALANSGHCYAVRRPFCDWACAHVAKRHGWDEAELVCFRIATRNHRWLRVCGGDLYRTGERTGPGSISAVKEPGKEVWIVTSSPIPFVLA